jgi:hypothetical protein
MSEVSLMGFFSIRVSGPTVSPPCPGSKGTARGGGRGRVRLEEVGASKHQKNRGSQCAKDRTDSERLVFGEDIDMDRVVEFSELAVVGRFDNTGIPTEDEHLQ